MDLSAAQNILDGMQREMGDGEEILAGLKANPNKADIKSFDQIAQEEIDTVNKRLASGNREENKELFGKIKSD